MQNLFHEEEIAGRVRDFDDSQEKESRKIVWTNGIARFLR